MKKSHSHSHSRARKVGCTVSAAALMLGVSHAATVGFNFQANYCSAPSYTGSPVTAPAFGVGTNCWESLTPMNTGYGCSGGYITLNEVIDTTTSTDGLNPLPSGSLSVTWSAYTANVSGFGGYDRSPPHYTFGGNGYRPGEEQVYWGFLRDGVNFGPGSSGGDNSQPGYSVDIVGLKSVFPNTPFVIELVASADSLETLTNAFIIDATHSSTQSVIYASTPPVGNVGDTAWTRGIGGGLSTVSGPVDADEVMIVGNRAEHVPNPGGFNRGSTIAGFIITDQPVVTMSPQPVVAAKGDNVTLRPIAIGVPPLSYQWRKGGVPIPGATASTYTITSITNGGDFDLVVTNLYGSSTSKVSTVTLDRISVARGPDFVLDSKPTGTAHDGANHGATWLAEDPDLIVVRSGVMGFAAADPDQIAVAADPDFNSSQGTIMFWMHSAGTTGGGNEGAMLFDRRSDQGLVIVQHNDGTIFVQPSGGVNTFSSIDTVSDDYWHHVAFVYDQRSNGVSTIYLDGVVSAGQASTGTWSWPAAQEIELGHSHDGYWRSFNGTLDDVRIYGRGLTDGEVAKVFADDSASLVAPSDLKLRFNFDTPPPVGLTLSWFSSGAVLQSADVAAGPYTDLPFAASPYPVSAQSAKKFYRYRHTPVSIISNPYDM
jgi:hypothetical protein